MIEVIVNSEFGSYRKKLNHGHAVFERWYRCTDAYEVLPDDSGWSECPCCNLKPNIWVFNNGRSTACGCGNDEYDHFSVHAESIMSVHTRNNGSTFEYDPDTLRKNWNEYCATMINPCSHGDLRLEDKW